MQKDLPRRERHTYHCILFHGRTVLQRPSNRPGLTTRRIRKGLEGRISLEQLRECWEVITPRTYLDRYAAQEKKALFIYGSCDTTFLPSYSEEMIEQVRSRKVDYKLVETPFKSSTDIRSANSSFAICDPVQRSNGTSTVG
jgi:hypothetical protein